MSATSTDYKSSANNCYWRGPPSPSTGWATRGESTRAPQTLWPRGFAMCSMPRFCSGTSRVVAAMGSTLASGCCVPSPGCFRQDPFRCLFRVRTFLRHRNRSLPRFRTPPSVALQSENEIKDREEQMVEILLVSFVFFIFLIHGAHHPPPCIM